MKLRLRYKHPEGGGSVEDGFDVRDDGHTTLEETSDGFRFAAAVAMFAENLRGRSHANWSDVVALASGAIGEDPHCYRHEFLDLVWRAAALSGTELERPATGCRADARAGGAMATAQPPPSPPDIWAFALEVLRLLPPLLAFPLFVLAFRRSRRG